NKENRGYWKIDWGRQGRVTFAYIIVFLGYYGIIVNFFMFEEGTGWLSFENIPEAIKGMLFWTYELFLGSYILPCLLLFFICFWLTYKEDIAHYGIRASLWLVPLIVFEGFIFYLIMFGFSFEPLVLQFGSIKGYINLFILFGINICGALSGKYLKKYIKTLREI
ncbi:MAG: hypothetical protein ACXAC7_22050, partial [Candidatus Hodarchaeales archaeon]